MQSNNHIGYAQGAWSGPGPVNPPDNNEWTDGAFCLAGSELFKLVNSTGTLFASSANGPARTMPSGRLLLFFPGSRLISVPAGAQRCEVYDMRGQLLYRQEIDGTKNSRTVALPEAVRHAGAIAVRFKDR
jgi:hypothetical protein